MTGFQRHEHGSTTPYRAAGPMAAVIAATVLHGMIHGFSIFLSPLNEQMRQFFAADSITAITAMKTTYLIVYAIGNLTFGVLTNRLSARNTLAAGMIVNGLAVAAFSTVGPGDISRMHLFWTLAALGGSVYHPIANVLITRLYPTRKGMVLGVTGVGAAIGFAFAPLSTGLLSATLHLSWQQVAVLFGMAGVAVGVIAWFFIPPITHESTLPITADTEIEPSETTSGNRASLGPLLLTLVIGIACLREIAMWSILDISDFFLTLVLTDSTRTGFFLFLLYLPGIFVKPMVGALSDKIGRKQLAATALIVYGSTIAATGVSGPLALIPVYLLMGIGQAATIPSIEAIVADSTSEDNRGVVFGIFITAAIGLGALGPLISGMVLDALGGTLAAFRIWMVVLGSLPFVGGIALAALRFPPHGNSGPQGR